jgi:hypothetical protein
MKHLSRLAYLWHNFGIHFVLILIIFIFCIIDRVWPLIILSGASLICMAVGGNIGYNRYRNQDNTDGI